MMIIMSQDEVLRIIEKSKKPVTAKEIHKKMNGKLSIASIFHSLHGLRSGNFVETGYRKLRGRNVREFSIS